MLDNLLEKLNIKYESLTEEEKRTYQQWSDTFTQGDVSIDDLKKFLPTYLDGLQHQQNDYDNKPHKDLYLKAAIRNAKMILAFISGPQKRKEWLQKHIEQRMKQ